MNSLEELSQARADVEHYAQLCREYSDRAETARAERETWEENHQILAEHYRRMTERAERAEAKLGDLRDDRDHWESVAQGWQNEVKRLYRELAEVDTQLAEIKQEYKPELRHAAKCQELVDTMTLDRDQSHQRAERAEKSALAFAADCKGWRHRAQQAEELADWRWHALIEMRARAEQAEATREEATRLMIQATSRAKQAENRAVAWWEASKTAVRQNQATREQARTNNAQVRADTWFELSKALMRALLALPHETLGGTP